MTLLHEAPALQTPETGAPPAIPMISLAPGVVYIAYKPGSTKDLTVPTARDLRSLKYDLENRGGEKPDVDCTVTLYRVSPPEQWANYPDDDSESVSRPGTPDECFALFTLADVGDSQAEAVAIARLTDNTQGIYAGRTVRSTEIYNPRVYRNDPQNPRPEHLAPHPSTTAELAFRLSDFKNHLTAEQLTAWYKLVAEERAAVQLLKELRASPDPEHDYVALERQREVVKGVRKEITATIGQGFELVVSRPVGSLAVEASRPQRLALRAKIVRLVGALLPGCGTIET